MSRWIALSSIEGFPSTELGWWALQFTPRVSLFDAGVLMEVQASQRLFGGAERLYSRIMTEAKRLGCIGGRTAQTAGGAAICLRHHPVWLEDAHQQWEQALPLLLDPLPLDALPAVAMHRQTLLPLGCRTLGDVRRLPRAGLGRRFGASLLRALDQAYGQCPEVFEWLTLPEHFEQTLELPDHVSHAEALLHGAKRLLNSMCAWLSGRQAGACRLTLCWHHDGARHAAVATGQLSVFLADASRDPDRLARLLDEHLQRTTLMAPVDRLSLLLDEHIPLVQHSDDLFGALIGPGESGPERLSSPVRQQAHRQDLNALLERLSVRLGASRVCLGQLRADHRPEQSQQWVPLDPATHGVASVQPSTIEIAPFPQPAWLLHEPYAIARSSLRILAGPHRIEAGWWDTQGPHMARDYFIAHHEQAGLLWVFRERALPPSGRPPWFVHGLF